AVTDWLIQPAPQHRDLLFQFENAFLQFFRLSDYIHGTIESSHVARFSGVKRCGTFRAIAVNGDRLQPQSPSFHVSVHYVVNGRVLRHVHRFRDCATEERLRRRHHSQMGHVMKTALTEMRAKGAIKNREMFWS